MTTETYHQDFFEFSSIHEHHHELEMSEKRWVKCCQQLKISNVYLIYQKFIFVTVFLQIKWELAFPKLQ